mmetsp:Transcript_138228/g.441694  ORF Transcript_138228/g.441694 Transcript_138228/m.441694 type:complete len:402 (+) Transcript_138228:527-1732(+)
MERDVQNCAECQQRLQGQLRIDRGFLRSWRERHVSLPQMLSELSQLLGTSQVWGPGRSGPNARDLVVSIEPFWLAPLLASVLSRPILAHFHVSMLLEFPSWAPRDLAAWWSLFHGMLALPGTTVSVSHRVLQAQVHEQSGHHFPYVPFLGLHTQGAAVAGSSRPQSPEVLVWRATEIEPQVMYVKLLLQLNAHWGDLVPFRVQDMVWQPSFSEIASYHAVVLLPKQLNELKLLDVFALQAVTFTPGEPMVHRFLWRYSRPFGIWTRGKRERAAMLQRNFGWGNSSTIAAQRPLRPEPRSRATAAPRPPALGLHSDLSSLEDLQARRYWWERTEWALLQQAGIQSFSGTADLLSRLQRLDVQERADIRRQMRQVQRVRQRRALVWWRSAVAGVSRQVLSQSR